MLRSLVGSEMCIRDRCLGGRQQKQEDDKTIKMDFDNPAGGSVGGNTGTGRKRKSKAKDEGMNRMFRDGGYDKPKMVMPSFGGGGK